MTTKIIIPDWPAPATVKAFISTRVGGVSGSSDSDGYHSLNLGDHVGDAQKNVSLNRKIFADVCSVQEDTIPWLKQVHGTNVLNLDEGVAGREADASTTSLKKTPCVVMTADCLPVFFCTEDGTRVAVAHAGWRGLANGVLESTVACFESPNNLLAFLGPAISQAHFEVGSEVYGRFVGLNAQNHEAFIDSPRSTSRDPRYMADIYLLARNALRKAGVEHVYGGGYCTFEDEEQFFSYRRDGAISGRFASLIYIS